METLHLEVGDDGIALCTFDRPDVRNALNRAMVDELNLVLDDLSDRKDLRVVIFTGSGSNLPGRTPMSQASRARA